MLVRGKKPMFVAAVLSVAFTVGGCGVGAREESGSTPGDAEPATPTTAAASGPGAGRVPVQPLSGTLPTPSPTQPSPGKGAPIQDQILYDLYGKVLKQAGVLRPMTGTCDTKITGKENQSTRCVVTFDGLQVPFSVEVTGGSFVASYRATTDKAVLLAEAVHLQFADHFGTGAPAGSLSCDATIPAKSLVALEKETEYKCYVDRGSGSGVRGQKVIPHTFGVGFSPA